MRRPTATAAITLLSCALVFAGAADAQSELRAAPLVPPFSAAPPSPS